jgi:hypothetical protein
LRSKSGADHNALATSVTDSHAVSHLRPHTLSQLSAYSSPDTHALVNTIGKSVTDADAISLVCANASPNSGTHSAPNILSNAISNRRAHAHAFDSSAIANAVTVADPVSNLHALATPHLGANARPVDPAHAIANLSRQPALFQQV